MAGTYHFAHTHTNSRSTLSSTEKEAMVGKRKGINRDEKVERGRHCRTMHSPRLMLSGQQKVAAMSKLYGRHGYA